MTDNNESMEKFPGYTPGSSYVGDTVAGGFILDIGSAPDPVGLAEATREILDRGLGNPRAESEPSSEPPTEST